MASALRNRCPACNMGKVLDGWLSVHPSCSVCGLDFSHHKTSANPVLFTLIFVSIIVCAAMLLVEITFGPPFVLHVLWLPLIALGTLFCQRLLKCSSIALRYKYQIEASSDDHES